MMRSLFAGVSGLRNHQVRLDVIGNNIANVNTVAYKTSRVTFKEAFAQMVQGASRPAGDASSVSGGVNPIQVGLGMNIGSIDLLFTQGNLENTGVTTDMAIQGDSFFVVSDGKQRFFTRSGNFQLDATGRLVASTNGFVVQGKMAVDGRLTDEIQDIKLPFGQKSAARPTNFVAVGGNLNAQAVEGASRETTITIFDSMGNRHELLARFEKLEEGQGWSLKVYMNYQAGDPDADPPIEESDPIYEETITFDERGRLREPASSPTITVANLPGGAEDLEIELSFGDPGSLHGLTQFASPSTVVLREQNGYTMGDLQRISVDKTGTITGAFTNGETLTLAQIILADFNNPSGLIRTGDNMYSVSANSGAPVLGTALEGSQSMITSGALEMSNVDLAQEFTSMITAQRGFQSNARVITTSDEMMQELVNLKR
jgi:flagellar hook protein FlgE